MTRKDVIGILVAFILIAVMIMPGSAVLVGDGVSSVALQTNGLLATKTSLQSVSTDMFQTHRVGYTERTFATGATSVYMRDMHFEIPNVAGETATVFVDRTLGFNLDGSGSGSASSYETGVLCMSGVPGNETQAVCDTTMVFSNFFAADALAVSSQMNIIGNVLPTVADSPGVTIGYNVEAMGTNVGISSVGARGLSVGGIGNTTDIGSVVRFDEKFTFNNDFMLKYTFSRDVTFRPPPMEMSPLPSICALAAATL